MLTMLQTLYFKAVSHQPDVNLDNQTPAVLIIHTHPLTPDFSLLLRQLLFQVVSLFSFFPLHQPLI